MTALGNDSPALSQTQSQLQALAALQKQIGSAMPTMLATMRGDIAAAVAQTQAVVQQGRATAANAGIASAADLASLSATSRAQVTGLIRDMGRFDPYLQFGSAEDEDAYRRREAERRAAIEAEQRKSTPEGDLNAAGGTVGQMADAYAHGAGGSPEFQQRWSELVATTEKLRAAAADNGVPVEAFDRNLREDLRRILKSKGLSDAQIDAHFVNHPDPLDAVKMYVASGDVDNISVSVAQVASRAVPSTTQIVAAENQSGNSLEDVMADLQAAGITMTSDTDSQAPSHGVAISAKAASGGGRNA